MKRHKLLLFTFHVSLFTLLTGCAAAKITTQTADGKTCSGWYLSALKDFDTSDIHACGAKGTAAGSKINTALAQDLLKTLLSTP